MQILRHQVVLGYPLLSCTYSHIDFIKVILLILNFEYFFEFHTNIIIDSLNKSFRIQRNFSTYLSFDNDLIKIGNFMADGFGETI
jgi:hypothetical protein